MILAAIDIGSNAIRLLLSQVFITNHKAIFRKIDLYRIPLRLGDDAFLNKEISPAKTENLIDTMIAFKHILNIYNPKAIMACGTSALRDAKNGSELVKIIQEKTSISIEIISGKREAEMIYSNHFEEQLDKLSSFLYIDVGGGSTELTLFHKGKSIESNSFNIGTVRLLQDIVDHHEWQNLELWIKQYCNKMKNLVAIGSGGNINKLQKLANVKNEEILSTQKLSKTYEMVKSFSYEERITKLFLKPDRADVIIPAAQIYLSILKWAKIKQIHVPQIGLVDGLIHVLYERIKKDDSNVPVT